MACLTDEQLAAAALGLPDGALCTVHVEQCQTCRAKLADLRQLTTQLAAVHAESDRTHVAARSRLLASLSNVEVTAPKSTLWNRLHSGFAALTPRQRIAAGSLGLSAVGLLLLIAIVATSATSLSAMERMAKQLRDVKSYSYRLYTLDTFIKNGETQFTTVVHSGTTFWKDPGSLYYDEKLVRTAGPAFPNEPEGGLLAHFTGVHFFNKRGIFIYHAGRDVSERKTYRWVPEMRPDEIDSGPIARLRMVREWDGEILRELGTKEIQGREARGYVMALKNAEKGSGFDALEVWVDPQTDLPLEFGYEVKTDETTREYRITDCHWNIEIDPKQFDTTPPAGYHDVTGPGDDATRQPQANEEQVTH